MMKLLSTFLESDRLKMVIEKISPLVGAGAAVSTLFFLDDFYDWRLWLLAAIAVIFGYGSAWAGLMKSWGYVVFSNDPLGWRKAKDSYKENQSPEGDQKADK